MKVIFISPMSATFELENNSIYYTENFFDVFLNGEKVLTNLNKNVFSIYDLKPNTEYIVKADKEEVKFKTDFVNKIIEINPLGKGINRTKDIQKIIDDSNENDLLIFNEGEYFLTPLFLKSNLNIYFKKGAYFKASTKEDDFINIEGEELKNNILVERGTWEGLPHKMKAALLNCLDCKNVKIFGEGTVDMDALNSTWFDHFKDKEYARPHTLFINQSEGVFVQGITFLNAAQWSIHPYYCENIGFFDFSIKNNSDTPNTDGINPQCVANCKIIGVYFDVGDDCIAIKSGKMDLAKKCKKTTENIEIRNCLMEHGHGAIVLGSEMSCGIKDLDIERCLFDKTDRGLRIKSRRGRGKDAIIDGVRFCNIIMKNVLTPFVINMFYFCDPDGKTEFVWSKKKLPVDDTTPYLGKFIFENIKCTNSEYCAGYFYGLPEQPIEEVLLKDVYVSFKENAGKGEPAMMSYSETLSKSGFVFNNVKSVKLENIQVVGCIGEDAKFNEVTKIDRS